MTEDDVHSKLPSASIRPERHLSAFWLLPVLALIFSGWLAYQAWSQRGTTVTIQFDQGHGLRAGDDVRYRGVAVGTVRSIEVAEDAGGLIVQASLWPSAPRLNRAGARFWIVRPRLSAARIEGLETIVGPRYLAMLPGDGPPQRHFVGLNDAPTVESIGPGDLEIVLQSARRGSLRPGAPVTYRQVPIGTVLSVGLTSDGGAVEARVHIEKAYIRLIRPQSRFWSSGGFEAEIGISGFSVSMESFESWLAGGVALATPPNAGEIVRNGHRFDLAAEPQEEWLRWQPLVAIGSSLLPPGAVRPSPLRAVIGWEQGRWFKSEKSRRGWVLQTADGLLGPADLLQPAQSEKVDQGSVVLEISGQVVPLNAPPEWTENGLALLDVQVSQSVWPARLRRVAEQPEDCLVIADPAAAPLPLAASRLTRGEHGWSIDPAVSVDESWHGACVLGRSDGKLLGMLVVDEERARVALLPQR